MLLNNLGFHKKVSRKNFLKMCLSSIGLVMGNSFLYKLVFAKDTFSTGRIRKPVKTKYDLVVVKGEDPYAITIKAIESIGGMGQFVKKGNIVVIKPNIGWDRTQEQAANTNPQVISALIDLCKKCGAKRINIFDNPCNDVQQCYENSGIEEVAIQKGAKIFQLDDWNVVKAKFSYKSPMQGWPIFRDAIECDTFINVPILKHHGLTKLTLSMKNLMGICSGNRGVIHGNIGKNLVDITDFIKPDLTVIDAYRVLFRHGPTGGNLKDVMDMKTIIVGTDPTLTDTYAAKLTDIDPLSIQYLKEAASRNFGNSDITKANILKLNI